jgi:hypothetical protein
LNPYRYSAFSIIDFTYVCDFKTFTVLLINFDDNSCVTTLKYKRDSKTGTWMYRHAYTTGRSYTPEIDDTVINHLDVHYQRYLQSLIIAKTRKGAQNVKRSSN